MKPLYLETSTDNMDADTAKAILAAFPSIIGMETFEDTLDPQNDGDFDYAPNVKRAAFLPRTTSLVNLANEGNAWKALQMACQLPSARMRTNATDQWEQIAKRVKAARPGLSTTFYNDLCLNNLLGFPPTQVIAAADFVQVNCYCVYDETVPGYWPEALNGAGYDTYPSMAARVAKARQIAPGKQVLAMYWAVLHEANGQGKGWQRLTPAQIQQMIAVMNPIVDAHALWGMDRLIAYYATRDDQDPYTLLAKKAVATWPQKPVGEVTMDSVQLFSDPIQKVAATTISAFADWAAPTSTNP